MTNIRIRKTLIIELGTIAAVKHGEPVRGLTRDDFTVFDEGHPQKIEFFSEATDAVPPLPPSLLPNTFTNELARRGATPESVVVILFDGLDGARSAALDLTNPATQKSSVAT